MMVQTGRREDEESIEMIVKLAATNIILYIKTYSNNEALCDNDMYNGDFAMSWMIQISENI